MATNLLAQILGAQTRNSTFTGPELSTAAHSLVSLLADNSRWVMSVDPAGERIIGAALSLGGHFNLIDRSRRIDGRTVLLVSGHMAGDATLTTRAAYARALGAANVEVATLGEWTRAIPGCSRVWPL